LGGSGLRTTELGALTVEGLKGVWDVLRLKVSKRVSVWVLPKRGKLGVRKTMPSENLVAKRKEKGGDRFEHSWPEGWRAKRIGESDFWEQR